MIVGKRVKELREQKGMSQAQLAVKLGVHPTQISLVENEKAGCLSIPKFVKLCDELDTSADDLLGRPNPCAAKISAILGVLHAA